MEEEEYEANMGRMMENDEFQDDIEFEYRYDDFFKVEQSLDSEEAKPFEEREWEEEEEPPVQDWETEAKKKINIEMDVPSEERKRKTVHDLNAYSSRPSLNDISKSNTTQTTTEPSKKIRYSVSMRLPGLARIDLSPLTQKIVGCIIGEDVTTEFPWVRVGKNIIEDNIDLHSESSDFLLVKDEVHAFPDNKIFIGYAPSLTEKGQFYIVLTEEGRDAVVKHIHEQREEHENRVKSAICKFPGRWDDLGSGADVDANVAKNTRPLFEIEVTSTADLLNVPIKLTDRKADDQRDGYIELLPNNRQIFENIRRKLVSRYTQVMPIVRHSEVQTAPSISVNSWYQYLYEYKTIDLSTYTEDKIEALKYFLKLYTDEVCDQVLMNSTWDIYANDYANLVRSEKDTQVPIPIGYEEHQSYYDGKIIVDKVINDLCWHPFWTGTMIAAYTQHAKSEHLIGPKTYDEVFLACEGNNKVLIWSFDDCLSPKLILECPREVTSVSVCPIDNSIIIGGCINGQIAIWHIPGKIEQVEIVVTQTSAQVKYSNAMKSLMTWMRETTSLISPTAMSSLKYSQKAGITQIVWVPSHHKIDKNGRILSLPEDAPLDDLSYQFATACTDGTVAFWDLKWDPMEKTIEQIRTERKKKIQPDIQESVTQPASPFKILDRVFKPHYYLMIQHPDENRYLVITTLSMYNPKFHKEQVEPFSMTRDDPTIRKYYRPIIEKPDYVMEPKILIGTIEGDFGCVTWTGYEFTEVGMNRETARWVWIKKVHDGPVTHVVRSRYYHQVVVTIGGKIFAVWRDDFAKPVICKKSNVGYSACSWGTIRPTVLILGRIDGTIEIWDFEVKSHEPSFMQSLSGRVITGIYTHELPLEPQCIGFCDFNGSLRTFTAPRVLLTYDVGDVEWMKKFIDRQVQRITEFRAWQESWCESNLEEILMKKNLKKMKEEKKRLEAEEKIKVDTIDVVARVTTPTKPVHRKPWQFIEEARERWTSMEAKRMQRVILEKKGLKKDILERQRAPLLRLRQEARTKKHKIREILSLQDKIFEETVMFLFPEQQERRETLLPPLPFKKTFNTSVRTTLDANYFFCKKEVFADSEEEIIYNFMEVQAEVLAKLKSKPFKRTFDWRKVLAQRKSRRRSMDIELKKLNRLKKTFKVDGAVNDASRLVDNV
ncbi:WD repeat-containing protein 63 [Acromyrmex echinatior]|uniref:WD repeat-containing protein 63 n=1 Tax=Acromyrmex echinatior TaxID=103372 RepID=F4WYX0_ACREC|nr:WD repeat-containing protein 63 [Acromyrmex echinatior]